jgi:hypothetical protein
MSGAMLNAMEIAALRAIEPALERRLSEVAPRGVQVWFTPDGSRDGGYKWCVTLFTDELEELSGRGNTFAIALQLALAGVR